MRAKLCARSAARVVRDLSNATTHLKSSSKLCLKITHNNKKLKILNIKLYVDPMEPRTAVKEHASLDFDPYKALNVNRWATKQELQAALETVQEQYKKGNVKRKKSIEPQLNACTIAYNYLTSTDLDTEGDTQRDHYNKIHPVVLPLNLTKRASDEPLEEEEKPRKKTTTSRKKKEITSTGESDLIDLTTPDLMVEKLHQQHAGSDETKYHDVVLKIYMYGTLNGELYLADPPAKDNLPTKGSTTKFKKTVKMRVNRAHPLLFEHILAMVKDILVLENMEYSESQHKLMRMTDASYMLDKNHYSYICEPMDERYNNSIGGEVKIVIFDLIHMLRNAAAPKEKMTSGTTALLGSFSDRVKSATYKLRRECEIALTSSCFEGETGEWVKLLDMNRFGKFKEQAEKLSSMITNVSKTIKPENFDTGESTQLANITSYLRNCISNSVKSGTNELSKPKEKAATKQVRPDGDILYGSCKQTHDNVSFDANRDFPPNYYRQAGQ